MDISPDNPTSTPTPDDQTPSTRPSTERRRTIARVAVAGGVAALGLSLGGIAVATADDGREPGPGVSGPWRFVDREGGPFGDELAERLAESLGLEEDQVAEALEDVREELEPERPDFDAGELPDPPSEAEIEERQEAFAAALAEALGVDQADVEAALEEFRAEVEADLEEHFAEAREAARAALVERLDEAVADGTLTADDKASVLKAWDEGVLDGPGLVRGFPGHGLFGVSGSAQPESAAG